MLREFITNAIASVALDRSRIEQEIQGLISDGFLNEKEGAQILSSLTEAAGRVGEHAKRQMGGVGSAVGRSVRDLLDLPARADLAELRARLDALEGAAGAATAVDVPETAPTGTAPTEKPSADDSDGGDAPSGEGSTGAASAKSD